MGDIEIAPSLNKLEYMLSTEVDLLEDVEDNAHLWLLHSMLMRLAPLLMEVERKQSKEFMKERKEAMDEVITLAHDAEDVADSYLDAIKRKDSRTKEARMVGSQIKRLVERLKILHARIVESCTTCAATSSSKRPLTTTTEDGKDDEDDVVVGLEDEVKRMMDLLLLKDFDEEEDARRVVVIPVVGAGGMGKTTLARKVYNDRNIKEHFPCRLWIHVSSDYKMEELLQDIIKQILINDDEEERKKMSLKDLAIEIYKLLKTTPTRYLVVFDDVCTVQFWADIHMLFPNNKNKEGEGDGGGSRIIFTTRHDEVASHVRPRRSPFYLRRLSKEKSWELFSKRVSHLSRAQQKQKRKKKKKQQQQQQEEEDEPWEAWVDACGGVPLTIVALAAEYHHRLILMDYKEEDVVGSVKRVAFPLEKLIFNHLPHHLKSCLAYLYFLQKSGRTEYQGFDFSDFKGLIVAEGLVKPPPPPPPPSITTVVELEDIAEEYVKELISRYLIQVTHWSFDEQIKTIIIPFWVASLLDKQIIYGISSSSSEDDVNISSNSKMKIQHVTNLGGWVLFEQDYLSSTDHNNNNSSISTNLKARSLSISRGSTTSKDQSERSLQDMGLQDMGLLRVIIDVENPTDSDIISYTRRGSHLMIHLRYLYLSSDSCSPRTITEYLSELWNLQFLKIVRSSTGRDDDDDEKGRLKLRKVNQLRHIMCYGFSLSLLIEKEVINSDDNNGGGGGGLLKNLQTLIGLDAEFCVEDVLSMTPNLVTLHLISKGTIIISQNQLVILPLLLKRLQKLELSCEIGANPEICHQNITHLVLRNTQINGGYLMRALRKLHKNLRVLELLIRSVSFSKEGEAGVLDFSSSDGDDDDDDDGFGQLKFLKLEDLKGLKEWKMSVGVMPSLQKELKLDSYNEQLRTDAKRLAEEHLPKNQLKVHINFMDLFEFVSGTHSKWPTTSQHNKPTSERIEVGNQIFSLTF